MGKARTFEQAWAETGYQYGESSIENVRLGWELREKEEAGAEPHCPTCICGRRAPVQRSEAHKRGPGSIAWEEHLLAWSAYDARYRGGQTAERLAERGGFSYGELVEFLGHEPKTWVPRQAHPQTA